ncbi:MAG: FHIPEP family type III secretion protein [Methylocystaceae bacterium]|nr:FHIPEP family type III secretion protein [Methylocystaceae bacterium]
MNSTKDIIVGAVLALVVVMMVLPLPTVFVDLMIALNILISLILLMKSVYISEASDFNTLPTVILITTIFRLALSITTTRLILLNGDAGNIVSAFGEVIIQGNIVVGAVVFLIITVVQFIVITKGSERVSEVSARFTLDSLPGKQMSIDRDVSSGFLDADAGREARLELGRRSEFYAAMDGAMKFVKGDSIAGLVIMLINLVGGISIAVLYRGLTVGDAAVIYSILTIGDGLVSQIPALLISIASGTIVTRVSDGTSNNLGSSLFSDLTSNHTALYISATVVTLLAFAPGFPTLIFLSVGAIVIVPVYLSGSKPRRDSTEDEEDEKIWSEVIDRSVYIVAESLCDCEVEISTREYEKLQGKEFNEEILRIKDRMLSRFGYPFPRLKFSDHANMKDYNVVIKFNDIPDTRMPEVDLSAHTYYRIESRNILDGVEDYRFLPLSYVEGYIVYFEKGKSANPLPGEKPITFQDVLITLVEDSIMRNSGKLYTIEEAKGLMLKAAEHYSVVTAEIEKNLPLVSINNFLNHIISEKVPIVRFELLLNDTAKIVSSEKDPLAIAEKIRHRMAPYIVNFFISKYGGIPAYILDKSVTDLVKSHIVYIDDGPTISMPLDKVAEISTAIRKVQQNAMMMGEELILLAPTEIRYPFYSFLNARGLNHTMLATREIDSPQRLINRGVVKL